MLHYFQVYNKMIHLYTQKHIYIYIYTYIYFFQIHFHYSLLQDIECSSLYYMVDPIYIHIYIHLLFFRFISIIVYYKIPNIVPCAIW